MYDVIENMIYHNNESAIVFENDSSRSDICSLPISSNMDGYESNIVPRPTGNMVADQLLINKPLQGSAFRKSVDCDKEEYDKRRNGRPESTGSEAI
jgi:hypothetical protein